VGTVAKLGLLGIACAAVLMPCTGAAAEGIGERPALARHVLQADIESGRLSWPQLLRIGEQIFGMRFNQLDGQGRPRSTGTGAPRAEGQPAFIRTSAPDSNSCVGCHNQPRPGGAGEFVANVFVLAQALDPVTQSVAPEFSNDRNTLGMHGAGAIELLAREMSFELLAIRDHARQLALQTGSPVRLPLVAKGVGFGAVTVLADGRVDPGEIEGVDWDLVVKPFHQKGAVVSLREFTNNAMNHHHGMQSVERFGSNTDPDGDGVVDELTVGDITAVTLFQAALPVPIMVVPRDAQRRSAIRRGQWVFEAIGCADCHVPTLKLNNSVFTEPNPFNPPGNLRLSDVASPVALDLVQEGFGPRLEPSGHNGAIVRAFTDLKRHDLCDADYQFFCNELRPQGNLAGNASAADFTVTPLPRPTSEFLTRKLWDAGSSDPFGHRGDLTTMTEAIDVHGGEARRARDAFFDSTSDDRDAVIEFLKSLQVL